VARFEYRDENAASINEAKGLTSTLTVSFSRRTLLFYLISSISPE